MKTDQIKLSPEFKTQTTKSIIVICFFTITYILLLALACALTALCVYAGIMLIISVPRFITLALGVGLASLGILILSFLIKFIFKSHKVDRSHLIEITKEEQPTLFSMIQEIVDEVGTNFPKKVYMSHDVNAAVFYDSNFWSMLFPIKKNLLIGMGLVNTVSKEELKAILSHEFGHFSQRTMKVGSYVYNVNQVIFNMLYDNDSYEKGVQSWANISGYIAIFAILAMNIISGIQWVLRKLYEVVNKSYLALSREMEFHADEIAANVTGIEPLKTSLLRMSLADHAFNNVLSFYQEKISENITSENIYKEHLFIMNFFAKDASIPIVEGLPDVSLGELNKFNKSKLVIKDQWASHPSTEERIKKLEETRITTERAEHIPANVIFHNIEALQQQITQLIFKDIEYKEEVSPLPFDKFESLFCKEFVDNSFSKIYQGYYDNKNPLFFDINKIDSDGRAVNIEELFSQEMIDLVYTSIGLQNDIETLEHVSNKTVKIKTFDYDGKKYKRKETNALLQKLRLELEEINKIITTNDIAVFKFFKRNAQTESHLTKLETLYRHFFEFDKAYEEKLDIYNKLSTELQFLSVTTSFDQIRANFISIAGLESKLKRAIKEMLQDPTYESSITLEMRENFDLYLSKEWKYFGNENYFESNLEMLFSALNNYVYLLSKGYFLLKKNLLGYQVELFETMPKEPVLSER